MIKHTSLLQLLAIVNKQPHARRTLYRISAFVCTALLVVVIKSPQAIAHSAFVTQANRPTTALAWGDSMIIGGAVGQAHSAGEISVKDAQSMQDQSLGDGFSISTNVQPLRITTELHQRKIYATTRPVVRLRADLAPGARRTVRRGIPSVTVVTERLTKWNDIVVDHQVVGKRLVRHARAAEIAAGPPRNVAEALALTKFRKLLGVFAMVATAYTAGSAQAVPTGRTATGALARYGVVAVDPRIIPLGAHVYIPGYGTAIASDTGGSIIGHRIDLCMDSLSQALNFGRQSVMVYVLGQ